MGQVLHGCARTTEAVRRAIQHSQTSLNALAAQYGINPKTVAKCGVSAKLESPFANLPDGLQLRQAIEDAKGPDAL